MIARITQQITNETGKLESQGLSMTRGNDFPLWMLSEEPGGEEPAGKGGLPGPRGHANEQTGAFSEFDVTDEAFKASAYVFMNPSRQVVGLEPEHKREKPPAGDDP